MNKRRIVISLIILIVILVFLIIGVIFIYYPAFPHNKSKAREIAVEYVNENFEQQMNYVGINVSVWETVLYSVYFSPENDPDLIFEVMLSGNFELPNHPDNYVLKYYQKEMYKILEPKVVSIWKGASALLVNHQPLLGFRIPEGLDETSTFEDIQGEVSYSLWVNINANTKDIEVQTEAVKVYEFIKNMQDELYVFEEISFFYIDERIEFKNWKEINNVSEIEEKYNKILYNTKLEVGKTH